jgi:hypothetical protein
VLVAAALAALAVFAWAAPSLHPGLTPPGVANGRLLPGPIAGTLAADGALGRPKSASRSASPVLAVTAVALRIPSDSLGVPVGRSPSSGRPAPGPSGRKSGGASHPSISLPADGQSPSPTPPSQPPAVSEPPSAPTPGESEQADVGWPEGDVARRPAELPGLPGEYEETGQNDLGEGDGDE